MSKNILFLTVFLTVIISFNAQYVHNSTGMQGTIVGNCVEMTSSGTYTDDGGGANYSNSIAQIYRTFCPTAGGQCTRVTFNAFDMESGSDALNMKNGPSVSSTSFNTAPADVNGWVTGTPATPFSYTASNSSGCLTFVCFTDNSIRRPGWSATISQVPCAINPISAGNSDCSGATVLCSGATLNDVSTGPGRANDACNGCMLGENFSNWYVLGITASGTLSMSVDPTDPAGDYDFAMYGPTTSCGALGAPVRCSYAAYTSGSNATGLGNGAADVSETVTGDQWVSQMNVLVGQTYILMVNSWASTTPNFALAFGGTASLTCSPLPVTIASFRGSVQYNQNTLAWITKSESNNKEFIVERSIDGDQWEAVGTLEGAGNSLSDLNYQIIDRNVVANEINYYRLKQFDFNGKSVIHEDIIALMNEVKKPTVFKVLNMLGQEISEDSKELRFIQYTNGTIERKIGE